MQERHDNDEIESHNHNEYPLLYKEAEISMSSLGKFLECWKCYILLVTCALVIYLICMPSGLRAYISGESLVSMLQLLHTVSKMSLLSTVTLSKNVLNQMFNTWHLLACIAVDTPL